MAAISLPSAGLGFVNEDGKVVYFDIEAKGWAKFKELTSLVRRLADSAHTSNEGHVAPEKLLVR